MKIKKNYNLSFDIGTNSVGWSATDMENELLKFKNKNMWGVRLFEEGETAKERRLFRNTRRRYLRRKNRIELLRSLIGSEIEKVDPTFLLRMNEMALWAEDKSFLTEKQKSYGNQSTLFMDENFTDADYYEKFRTIYHLREYLMKTDEKADIRLVYLALHHILKYRGNFIREGKDLIASKDLKVDINELLELLSEMMEINDKGISVIKLENILTDKNKSKKEKTENFTKEIKQGVETLDKVKESVVLEISKALVGLKANYTKIFFEDNIKDDDDKDINVAFSDTKYEELEEKMETVLSEKFYLVEVMKNLNSGIILSDILKGKVNISEAMYALYEKHGEDLKILKKVIKEDIPKSYNEMFKNDLGNEITYAFYINNGKCDIKEFYKYVEKILKKSANQESAEITYIREEIENEKFLNKINSKNNGAIPYQLHLAELEAIIENQGKYYPILKENKDKIKSILEFRIPYYVGPLNPYIDPKTSKNRGFAWLVKKTNEKIYPWNFEEVVDIDKSAEIFIERMRNNCSYLSKEEVLPKNSLIFSKYELLNELNKVRINEKLISVELKNRIIDEVFLNNKSFKDKAFKNWLVKSGEYSSINNIEIRGYQKDGEFASSLSSYIDFIGILSEKDIKSLSVKEKKEIISTNEDMIEEIIKWISLFEDKKILKRKLKNRYENLTEKQISKISKLNYKGWGSLSRELLNGIFIIDEKNKKVTIISRLEDSNDNFMQIINDKKLGFDKLIEEKREKVQEGMISLEMIQKLHGSPAIKKAIWQTVKIAEEIVKIMGYPPKNFYIEFAREDQDSKRTNSRKMQLEKSYKLLKDETNIYNKAIADELKNEKNISSERLFLYYLQNGKCMYSGEALDIDDLSHCEIDHIVPQSYIFDDSFENKVLVKRIENQNKTDKLTLSQEIRGRMTPYWTKLKKVGLMTQKKFDNLTKIVYDEKDMEKFLNRQLVETRQITKHVANILSDCYKDSKVVAIKAGLNSLYRKKYNIPKLRELNDLHHAHDAYIASVIGNFIEIRYPKLDGVFDYKSFHKTFEKQKTSKNKYGFVISAMDNNVEDEEKLLWDASKEILRVIRILNYKGCNVTKKLEKQTGGYYNINALKAVNEQSKNKNLVEKKDGLEIYKYGGYSGIQPAYFIVVEYKDKNKIKKEIMSIPIMVDELINNGRLSIEEYLNKQLGTAEYTVVKNKIYKNQKIYFKDTYCYVVGPREVANATQLIFDLEQQRALEKILKNKKADNKPEIRETILNEWIKKSEAYYKLYETEVSKVKNYKEKGYFDMLCASVEDANNAAKDNKKAGSKDDLLKNILSLTSSSPRVDLTLYNNNLSKADESDCKLSSGFGRKSITINIDEVIFIDESITGLYSRKYSL